MKNAAKRIFSCKNRSRYSRKRATFCRNLANRRSLTSQASAAVCRGRPGALGGAGAAAGGLRFSSRGSRRVGWEYCQNYDKVLLVWKSTFDQFSSFGNLIVLEFGSRRPACIPASSPFPGSDTGKQLWGAARMRRGRQSNRRPSDRRSAYLRRL